MKQDPRPSDAGERAAAPEADLPPDAGRIPNPAFEKLRVEAWSKGLYVQMIELGKRAHQEGDLVLARELMSEGPQAETVLNSSATSWRRESYPNLARC